MMKTCTGQIWRSILCRRGYDFVSKVTLSMSATEDSVFSLDLCPHLVLLKHKSCYLIFFWKTVSNKKNDITYLFKKKKRDTLTIIEFHFFKNKTSKARLPRFLLIFENSDNTLRTCLDFFWMSQIQSMVPMILHIRLYDFVCRRPVHGIGCE